MTSHREKIINMAPPSIHPCHIMTIINGIDTYSAIDYDPARAHTCAYTVLYLTAIVGELLGEHLVILALNNLSPDHIHTMGACSIFIYMYIFTYTYKAKTDRVINNKCLVFFLLRLVEGVVIVLVVVVVLLLLIIGPLRSIIICWPKEPPEVHNNNMHYLQTFA